MYCTIDNAGPDGANFLNIVGCCNYTEAKSREVCTVFLDYFSKTERHLQKTLHLVLEHVKNCRSGVSLVTLSCSGGQILVH